MENTLELQSLGASFKDNMQYIWIHEELSLFTSIQWTSSLTDICYDNRHRFLSDIDFQIKQEFQFRHSPFSFLSHCSETNLGLIVWDHLEMFLFYMKTHMKLAYRK